MNVYAQAPVAIADVGEYSNGKSALLGALLGNMRLLPTSDSPSTGNVTVLRLSRGAPGRPTRIASATVHFMSAEDVDECVDFILRRLVGLVSAAGAAGAAGAHASTMDGYRPRQHGWARFDTWCRDVLWRTAGPDNAAKMTAVELTRIRDALLDAPHAVAQPGDDPRPVDPAVLAGGVSLPSATAVPEHYPQYRPGRRTDWFAPLGADHLEVAFPLIRRIDCEVEVDPLVWPLHRLAGLTVEFRDFPGLLADGSKERDLYLSRRELAGVDAILAVVYSPKPAAKALETYYAQLRELGYADDDLERATVVAANFFDRPEVPAAPPATTLPELLGRSSLLNDICVAAENLTLRRQDKGEPLDRLVLTSALGDGTTLSPPLPATALADLQACQGDWRAAATALATGDERRPAQHIAALLAEFGRDGGLGQLREVLEEHARGHGVANKIARMERDERVLDQALARYAQERQWRRRRDEPTSSSDVADLRILVSELGAAAEQVKQTIHEFRTPRRLLVERPGRAAQPLLADVEAAARQAVQGRGSWHLIMDHLDDEQPWIDRIGPVGEATGASRGSPGATSGSGSAGTAFGDPRNDPFKDPFKDPSGGAFTDFDDFDDIPDLVDVGPPGVDGPPPTDGRVLVDEFAGAARRLVEEYRAVLLDIVARWERAQRDRLSGFADRFAEPRIRHLSMTVLGRGRMQRIDVLVGDIGLHRRVTARLDELLDLDEVEAKARHAAPFDPDQRLPWHPDVAKKDDPDSERDRHVFGVLRMRLEAERAMTDFVQSELAALTTAAAYVLEGWLRTLRAGVPSARQLDELLRAGDEPAAAQGRERRS